MNKTEANISLLIITFFAAIQYIFLARMPEGVSHFAFLCITNLVGFLITLAFFFNELFRLDKSQIYQGFVLSGELIIFNIFLLMGSAGLSATITAGVLSTYFIFIALSMVIFFKQIPGKNQIVAIILIAIGLFLISNAQISSLLNRHVLYLIIANIAFAAYIITAGNYAASSNPSILALGQMFFCFIGSFILWVGEALFFGADFKLPFDKNFWGSVIYISFFIRGLYGVVQIYAQRYTSPLSVSIIFSSEVIMTMFASPVLTRFFNTQPEEINFTRVVGALIMVLGLLMTEIEFFKIIVRIFRNRTKINKT